MRNYVVIPTRDKWADAAALVEELVDQGETDAIFLFDNNPIPQLELLDNVHDDGEFKTRVKVTHSPGWSIYEMWNVGMQWGAFLAANGESNITILNDDIRIPKGFIGKMAAQLRSTQLAWLVSPDYNLPLANERATQWLDFTTGTYKDGGVCGWAFMLRGEKMGNTVPFIDRRFRWWCGDDDLVKQIELKGGLTGIIRGLPVEHEGTATGGLYPHLHQVGQDDLERFKAKYGG